MSRPINLIIYNSPLFAAHWSLFIPNPPPLSNDISHKGKINHVTGDSLNGFVHGIKRNHDLQQEDRLFTLVLLCNVEEQNIIDPVDAEYVEENGEEVRARDVIEESALSVRAPGKSLRTVGEEVCLLVVPSLGLLLISESTGGGGR